MENAAKMADIHDSILNWPNGYNTQVSESGRDGNSCSYSDISVKN